MVDVRRVGVELSALPPEVSEVVRLLMEGRAGEVDGISAEAAALLEAAMAAKPGAALVVELDSGEQVHLFASTERLDGEAPTSSSDGS